MTQRKNVFLVSSRHISIHHLLHTWNAFHAIVQNVVSSFFCLFWHTEWIRIDKQQIFQVHKAEWTEIVEISRQSTLTHFGMCCVLQSNSIIYKSRSSHLILIPKYIHTHTHHTIAVHKISHMLCMLIQQIIRIQWFSFFAFISQFRVESISSKAVKAYVHSHSACNSFALNHISRVVCEIWLCSSIHIVCRVFRHGTIAKNPTFNLSSSRNDIRSKEYDQTESQNPLHPHTIFPSWRWNERQKAMRYAMHWTCWTY